MTLKITGQAKIAKFTFGTIHDAVKQAIAASKEYGCPVIFEFNAYVIQITPDSDSKAIYEQVESYDRSSKNSITAIGFDGF